MKQAVDTRFANIPEHAWETMDCRVIGKDVGLLREGRGSEKRPSTRVKLSARSGRTIRLGVMTLGGDR